MKKTLLIILVLVALVGLAFAGYALYHEAFQNTGDFFLGGGGLSHGHGATGSW